MRFFGFQKERLIENDPYYAKEIAFVKAINKNIDLNPNFLSQIVGKTDENGKKEYLDDTEEKVALSIIQWLGTNVGQAFLRDVAIWEEFSDVRT